jgi:ribose transport system substrate-binding protein
MEEEMSTTINKRLAVLGALVLLAALVLSACGGGSGSSSSSSGSGGSTEGASGGGGGGESSLASFEAAAKKAEEPTKWPGPKTSPPAVKGKKIAVILCAAVAEGCARVGEGAKQAAEAIGWQVTVQDGKGEPNIQRSLMLQDINEGYNGIVLAVIDSSTVGDAMQKAREAGVLVVSPIGGNEIGETGSDVFGQPNAEPEKAGEDLANWVIAHSGGEAKIAMFHSPDFKDSISRYEGSKKVFEECEGCDIETDETYSSVSAAQQLPLRVKSVLLAHPEINWVWVDIGANGALAVNAIREQGLQEKVHVASFDCNLEDLKHIREELVQPVCEGLGLEDSGWGAVDELNRGFSGMNSEEAKEEEDIVPLRAITKSTLPEPGEPWRGDFDYEAEYKKLWGVG